MSLRLDQKTFFFFFFFFLSFRSTPVVNGSFQAKGSNQSYSCQPMLQSQQCRVPAMSVTYTTTHGNVRSLTQWSRPGIKPESSWILVRFITTEPQQELQKTFYIWHLEVPPSPQTQNFFFFFFFFFLAVHVAYGSYWPQLRSEEKPSCSCDLCYGCSNTRFLTYCAREETAKPQLLTITPNESPWEQKCQWLFMGQYCFFYHLKIGSLPFTLRNIFAVFTTCS